MQTFIAPWRDGELQSFLNRKYCYTEKKETVSTKLNPTGVLHTFLDRVHFHMQPLFLAVIKNILVPPALHFVRCCIFDGYIIE